MFDNSQSILTDSTHLSRSADDSNMIPLINIVFLMLIFFMVAGKISATDRAQFDAPATTLEGGPLEDSLNLIVDAQKNLWIDDRRLGSINSLNSAHWQELENHLVAEPSITLKLDAEIPAKSIDLLLETLRKHDVKRIQLAIQNSLPSLGLTTP